MDVMHSWEIEYNGEVVASTIWIDDLPRVLGRYEFAGVTVTLGPALAPEDLDGETVTMTVDDRVAGWHGRIRFHRCGDGVLRVSLTILLLFALTALGCGPETDDDDPDTGIVDPDCPFEGHTSAVDWTLVETAVGLDGADVSIESMGAFLSVWGTCAVDVWVVGGQPDDGRAVHFDGEIWSEVALPDGPLLNWVFGFDDGSVWFVGNEGLSLHSADGTTFEVVETGVDVPLWGVWGSGPDDVWAVGRRRARSGRH